jgi:hypothetical protein
MSTYGCGIHTYWPCSTVEWANEHLLISDNTIVNDNGRYNSDVIYVGGGSDNNDCGNSSSPSASFSHSTLHFN